MNYSVKDSKCFDYKVGITGNVEGIDIAKTM